LKNIAIKFCGKSTNTPNVVYGDLIHYDNSVCIKDAKGTWAVYPDSIAQLIGFDIDGEEIYEGDILVDADNNTITAAIYPNAHYQNYKIKV